VTAGRAFGLDESRQRWPMARRRLLRHGEAVVIVFSASAPAPRPKQRRHQRRCWLPLVKGKQSPKPWHGLSPATRGSVSAMSAGQSAALVVPTEIACGVVAGPLFVSSFTAIGTTRAGYDWRRHAVSSLARGRGGWLQRANFVLTGTLYCIAANGVARSPKQSTGPRVVSALIFGVGGGLIGSGLFVTDPVAGFRPASRDHDDPGRTPSIARTRSGRLHTLCAIPIFAGIPVAALICATSATRRGEYCWASYSAGSALAMTSAFVLCGAAFGGKPRLAGRGGVFQRISITAGFGWLSALSLRTLIAVLPSRTR
jgi:Protein of unknown function (DUF998)